MTPFEEAMAAPRIEVIDAAIAHLQAFRPGGVRYSCLALHGAVARVYRGTLGPGDAHEVSFRYIAQYQQSCLTTRGKTPWWWSSVTAGPGPRLHALRRFRQLCLDAAK
jgi:hypothetical protein